MIKLQAHRGVSTEAPENTLSSIELAAAQGYAIAEVDVSVTKDGKFVLLHDDTLNLKTGAAFSGRYGSAYVNDDHFDLLLASLDQDIRAGQLCGWHHRKSYDKDYNNLLSIEQQPVYDVCKNVIISK